jgi:hypothetical protein
MDWIQSIKADYMMVLQKFIIEYTRFKGLSSLWYLPFCSDFAPMLAGSQKGQQLVPPLVLIWFTSCECEFTMEFPCGIKMS